MKTMTFALVGAALLAVPAVTSTAYAQGDDAAYCGKLANTYENYLAQTGRHGAIENGPAQVAISQCRAGDYSGIPMLEKQLTDAKFDLPAR